MWVAVLSDPSVTVHRAADWVGVGESPEVMSHSQQQSTRSLTSTTTCLAMTRLSLLSMLSAVPSQEVRHTITCLFFNYNEWLIQTRTSKKGLCSSQKSLSIKVEHSCRGTCPHFGLNNTWGSFTRGRFSFNVHS